MNEQTNEPAIFSLDGRCRNACRFCRSPAALEDWKTALEQIPAPKDPKDGRLVINGREPLRFPALDDVLRSASRRGLSNIRLETCGLEHITTARIQTWMDNGLREICVILPAAGKRLYSTITGHGKGFDLCMNFIEFVTKIHGLVLCMNIPVCAENSANIKPIIELAAGKGFHGIILDVSTTHEFWPKQSREAILNDIRSALEFGVSKGLAVSLKGAGVHTANVFQEGRIIKENKDHFCLFTYFQPGRERRREVFSADFRLTHRCNQNCVFCAAAKISKPDPAPAEVMAALKETLNLGVQRVCFEGGEPSLITALPDYIRMAHDAGVRDVVLMTNGVRAADPCFVDRIASAGANRVFVSLHAPTPALSDAITRTPGSFRKTVAGIRNFLDAGLQTSLIFVMTKMNLDSLPRHIHFVKREFGPLSVLLSMVTPYFAPALNATLIPRYIDIERALTKGRMAAGRCGVTLSAMEEQHRPPDCVLKQIRGLIRNLYVPLENCKSTEGYVKPTVCSRCEANEVCPGVKDFYARAHGLSEFSPL